MPYKRVVMVVGIFVSASTLIIETSLTEFGCFRGVPRVKLQFERQGLQAFFFFINDIMVAKHTHKHTSARCIGLELFVRKKNQG